MKKERICLNPFKEIGYAIKFDGNSLLVLFVAAQGISNLNFVLMLSKFGISGNF